MIIGGCKRNAKTISNQSHKMIVSPYSYCLLYISQKSFMLSKKAVNQLLSLNLGLKYAHLIITELTKAKCWEKLLEVFV